MQVEETHYESKAKENFKEINHFCCFTIKNEAYMQACHATAITKDTCQKRIKIVAAQQKK